jgi:hypothetical protein
VAKSPPGKEIPRTVANVPPPDLHPTSDIRLVMIEVAKLQTQHEFVQRDVGEARTDMKDVRDRLSRLEIRVDHLPSKGFIAAIVMTAVIILGGLFTIAPKLQSWLALDPQLHSQADPSLSGKKNP